MNNFEIALNQFVYLLTDWEFSQGLLFGLVIFPILPDLLFFIGDLLLLLFKFLCWAFERLVKN